MSISNARFHIALFVAPIFLALISNVSASPKPSHHTVRHERVYDAQTADVPLQPFSFDKPTPHATTTMQVAYYAPRAIPRATRIEEDEETETMPQFENSHARPTVAGNRAVLRNGIAYAPSNAPANVKAAIWAVNTIRHKPYHWGGGHGSFNDSGYDCSGAVSFALHYAGVLNLPLPSSDFSRYGERGRGRWITIYSRRGHTFAMIAGLRLDTTDFRYGGAVGPRWYADGRDTWGFDVRHPAGL